MWDKLEALMANHLQQRSYLPLSNLHWLDFAQKKINHMDLMAHHFSHIATLID